MLKEAYQCFENWKGMRCVHPANLDGMVMRFQVSVLWCVPYKTKRSYISVTPFALCSGGGTRTHDLRIMNPTL